MDKKVLCEIDHMHKMELKSFFPPTKLNIEMLM